jgi:hypothetical protein
MPKHRFSKMPRSPFGDLRLCGVEAPALFAVSAIHAPHGVEDPMFFVGQSKILEFFQDEWLCAIFMLDCSDYASTIDFSFACISATNLFELP